MSGLRFVEGMFTLIIYGIALAAAWGFCGEAFARLRRRWEARRRSHREPLTIDEQADAIARFLSQCHWMTPADRRRSVDLMVQLHNRLTREAVEYILRNGADDPIELATLSMALTVYYRQINREQLQMAGPDLNEKE